MMKFAAEVLKYVLNDGGFKVFAAKCGHKDICQWQDIHNVLVATYEALLKSAVEEFTNLDKNTAEGFWKWVKILNSFNDDEFLVTNFYLSPRLCGFLFCYSLRKLAPE